MTLEPRGGRPLSSCPGAASSPGSKSLTLSHRTSPPAGPRGREGSLTQPGSALEHCLCRFMLYSHTQLCAGLTQGSLWAGLGGPYRVLGTESRSVRCQAGALPPVPSGPLNMTFGEYLPHQDVIARHPPLHIALSHCCGVGIAPAQQGSSDVAPSDSTGPRQLTRTGIRCGKCFRLGNTSVQHTFLHQSDQTPLTFQRHSPRFQGSFNDKLQCSEGKEG